jgi:hypothetical protein
MELKEAIRILKQKFQAEVDISNFDCPILSFNNILKAEFQNQYVALRENARDNQLEITFFKSDQKNDKLFDDYTDVGICFYPKSTEHLKIILDSVDA